MWEIRTRLLLNSARFGFVPAIPTVKDHGAIFGEQAGFHMGKDVEAFLQTPQ